MLIHPDGLCRLHITPIDANGQEDVSWEYIDLYNNMYQAHDSFGRTSRPLHGLKVSKAEQYKHVGRAAEESGLKVRT
jgi:hypothetical protein